ncbi:MAG: hypothetical protein AABY22_24375, partial [Nanoarchaeota archaeon]
RIEMPLFKEYYNLFSKKYDYFYYAETFNALINGNHIMYENKNGIRLSYSQVLLLRKITERLINSKLLKLIQC